MVFSDILEIWVLSLGGIVLLFLSLTLMDYLFKDTDGYAWEATGMAISFDFSSVSILGSSSEELS